MADLSGFPTAEVQFDRDANIVGSADDVLRLAADPTISDLLVLSHGWNNDLREARQLYRDLASSLRSVLDSGAAAGLANRKIAIAGVLWPSKKFADSDLIPGGAAAAASPVDSALILEEIDGLRAVFPDPAAQQTLDSVSALVPLLPDKGSARASFADQLRSLLDASAAEPEDGSTELFAVSGRTLMDRLAIPVSLAPPTETTGGAAGIFGIDRIRDKVVSTFGGPLGAALNVLNFTTYYEMKNRAGIIGERGLAPVLVRLHSTRPDLNIHLVGHSFGARLVSAAAKALPASPPGTIATLSLLQAAFSHYGFADDWDARNPGQQRGYFRNVITENKVTGPMLITHTGNDTAVGIAYAIASRAAGQVAAAVGDANDIYGGIGRNGAQKTAEAVPAELLDVGGNYTWRNQTMHNLLADRFISGHSAVTGKQVAHALLSAFSTT